MSESFSRQVQLAFDDLSDDLYEAKEKAKKDVARLTAKELRNTSPRAKGSPRSGRYAKGWSYRYGDETYVYNQTDWQLTHLLADGHQLYNRFGGPYKTTKANPHIDNAEAFAATELPIRVSRGLK